MFSITGTQIEEQLRHSAVANSYSLLSENGTTSKEIQMCLRAAVALVRMNATTKSHVKQCVTSKRRRSIPSTVKLSTSNDITQLSKCSQLSAR